MCVCAGTYACFFFFMTPLLRMWSWAGIGISSRSRRDQNSATGRGLACIGAARLPACPGPARHGSASSQSGSGHRALRVAHDAASVSHRVRSRGGWRLRQGNGRVHLMTPRARPMWQEQRYMSPVCSRWYYVMRCSYAAIITFKCIAAISLVWYRTPVVIKARPGPVVTVKHHTWTPAPCVKPRRDPWVGAEFRNGHITDACA